MPTDFFYFLGHILIQVSVAVFSVTICILSNLKFLANAWTSVKKFALRLPRSTFHAILTNVPLFFHSRDIRSSFFRIFSASPTSIRRGSRVCTRLENCLPSGVRGTVVQKESSPEGRCVRGDTGRSEKQAELVWKPWNNARREKKKKRKKREKKRGGKSRLISNSSGEQSERERKRPTSSPFQPRFVCLRYTSRCN